MATRNNHLSLTLCLFVIAAAHRVSSIYDPSVTTTKPPVRRENVVVWYLNGKDLHPPEIDLSRHLGHLVTVEDKPKDDISWPKDEFLIDDVSANYIKTLDKQNRKKDEYTYEGVPDYAKKPKKEKLIRDDPKVALYDKKLGVRCPTDRATGTFIYPPDCQYFVNCYKGAAFVQQCPPGTVFNPKTLECDFRHKVTCYGTELSDLNAYRENVQSYNQNNRQNILLGVTSGIEENRDLGFGDHGNKEAKCPPFITGLVAHPTDCTKYLQCVNGGTLVRDCGPGTVFNPLYSVCDHPHNVRGCEKLGQNKANSAGSIGSTTSTYDLNFAHSSPSGHREPKNRINFQPGNRDSHNFNQPSNIPIHPSYKPSYPYYNHSSNHNTNFDSNYHHPHHQNHHPHPFHNTNNFNHHHNHDPNYHHHHNHSVNYHPHNPSTSRVPVSSFSSSNFPHNYPTTTSRYNPKEVIPNLNNYHHHENPAIPSTHYKPSTNYYYNSTRSHIVFPENQNPAIPSTHYKPINKYNSTPTPFGTRINFPDQNKFAKNDSNSSEKVDCNQKFSANPILQALAVQICHNVTQHNQTLYPNPSSPLYPSNPVLSTTPINPTRNLRPGIWNPSNYHPDTPHNSHNVNPVWTHSSRSNSSIANSAHARPTYDSQPPYYPSYPIDSEGQESNIGSPQILPDYREPNIYLSKPEADFTETLNSTNIYRPAWKPRNSTSHASNGKNKTDKPWPPPLGALDSGPKVPFEIETANQEKQFDRQIDNTTWRPIFNRNENLLDNKDTNKRGEISGQVEKSNVEKDKRNRGKVQIDQGHSKVNDGNTMQDQGSGPKPPRVAFGVADYRRRFSTTKPTFTAKPTTSTSTTTTTTVRTTTDSSEDATESELDRFIKTSDSEDSEVEVLDVEKETWKPTLVYENKTKPDESSPTTQTPDDKSVIMKIGGKNRKQNERGDSSGLELAPWEEEEEPFPVYYIPGVTPMHPNIKSKIVTPISGQYLRLRGGPNPREGYVEVQGVQPGWGIICDTKNSWTLKEADIVCKQLGYLKGAEMAWQGRNKRSNIPDWVAANSVECLGNETRIQHCRFTHEESCRVDREAVGVRCLPNRVAHCEDDETPHENHCYHLANPEQGLNHAEALDYCNRRGAGLIDITNQAENNFVSEWLTQNHPEVTSIMTSGVGFKVMNVTIWLWENNSNAKFKFSKWWPGWMNEKRIQPWTSLRPACVVMKRWFPCHSNPDENCQTDYFFWDTEDCSASQKGHSYVCKRPYDDIGCVYGKGNQYSGNASMTSSGKKCLSWADKRVAHPLMLTVPNYEVRAELIKHNYCRNPNPKKESRPWCYVGLHGEKEYCDIPSCGFYGSGKSPIGGRCKPKHFECLPGECIPSPWVCDGEEDCTNGADEKTCSSHLSLFKKVTKHKLEGYDVEKWLNTPIKTCALRCKDADFTCRSFTHKADGNVCLLSDRNVGMTGALKPDIGYDYYELNATSLDCKDMFLCNNNKCVNQSSVCDGKNDCNDRSDEKVCSDQHIDYGIRLAGSNNTNEGRVEVKAFGKWGQVCDDGFGMINAGVVCRELGFEYGALQVRPGGFYGNMDPPTMFMVDQLQCRGDEKSLRECDFEGWGIHNCLPEEAVGVVCRNAVDHCQMDQWKCDRSPVCISTSYICDEVKDCPDGSDESSEHCEVPFKVRLVNGTNEMEGRVEVRHHGIWGTVCDDDFNVQAATVICRSLGYGGTATFMKNGYFGSGSGPIWLDSVFCRGNETQLNRCDHNDWGHHNCNHNEDVGVICSPGEVAKREPEPEVPVVAKTNIRDILPTYCGLRPKDFGENIEDEIFGKIVRGNIAPKGSYPWQASIRLRAYSRSSHWCGAVVLSPIHVLTAAHCLYGYNKGSYFVRAGDYNSEIEEESEAEANIEDYYIHEEFAKGHRFNNDIALVRLKGNGLPLGKDIMPICLPRENTVYTPGLNCTISGFGSIEFQRSGHSRDMRFGWVPLLDQSVCRAEYVYGEGAIRDGMVCAGHLDEGVDTCDGDSGGPLACLENGVFTLYGLTSWGQSCGRANKPGVYVRIAHYRQWISDKIIESLTGR